MTKTHICSGRVGETARARGYLRPATARFFYIDILARAAARGRRPEGCEAGSYRQNGPFGPLPKPKFGRGDGRLGDRPAVAPSGWREIAVPMRGHRHHSRIGRANALTAWQARAPRLPVIRATGKPSGCWPPVRHSCDRILLTFGQKKVNAASPYYYQYSTHTRMTHLIDT